ncbi:biotin/lipoyl-binding protein [Thauera sp.]|uniref:biotin/lipoyl-binding protein n=1 Tax=Thauera sp. TaxID=1905334 RepID=UPI0039E4AC3C
MTLQPRSVQLSTQLPGRTVPYMVAEVRPQVGGILRERAFTEGSDVKAGQPLYRIDPAPYQAALSRAQASLDAAQSLIRRYEQLIKTRAIS